MALKVEFSTKDFAMPVPYEQNFSSGRTNIGFVDLRKIPQAVADLPEARESLALTALLAKAAEAESQVFTIGCDLGEHKERIGIRELYVAGGYVQFSARDYVATPPTGYLAHARSVSRLMKDAARYKKWKLHFELTPCYFSFENRLEAGGSVGIWFFAYCGSNETARHDREVLLSSLTDAMFDSNSLSKLTA